MLWMNNIHQQGSDLRSYRFASIVVPACRIGRSEHRRATLEGSDHTALCDADALLLHCLQQRVLLRSDLVQLVNAAHALVC